MDAKGFHAGILITVHGLSFLADDMRLLCDYYKKRTNSPIQIWAGEMFGDLTDAPWMTDPGDGGHAGICETSCHMAVDPEGVDLDRINKPLGVPEAVAGGNDIYGYYCSPKYFGKNGSLPTLEYGQEIMSACVDSMGRIAGELLSKYHSIDGYKAPSLIDTEVIWERFCLLTRKYWGCVLTSEEAVNGYCPPMFPGWGALGE